ncbi:winged helix-turn-helix transcriptional regulator [Nocardia wallacei]|uniref:winged helix-turn-helix transcriptional regulator n=1 Tax=Nocardia wallacei TaxID=480035 RepID=UPI002457F512|nr:helix-turn-helix domain-containing protein [Nocardia wallacei]
MQARSGCPVNATIEVIGDKWTMLVLRDVMFGDRRHFRELLAGSEEGIASNILSDRLKRLVAAGLLSREDTRPGQKAEYRLTEAAIQLVPVMAQLGSWGLRNRPTTQRLRVRAELLEDGGPALWEEFMDELRESHLGIPRPADAGPAPSERLRAAYERAIAEG